jgi:hypothetical protein
LGTPQSGKSKSAAISFNKLFVRKLRNFRAFAGVPDRYGANIPVAVEIQQCVVIEVFGLSNLGGNEIQCKAYQFPESI